MSLSVTPSFLGRVDARLKLLLWALLTLMTVLATGVPALAVISLVLLAGTAALALAGLRIRPGYGRGLVWMILAGVVFNVISAALRRDGPMPLEAGLLSLWRILLLVWAAVLLHAVMSPPELAGVLGVLLKRLHIPAGDLPLIVTGALQMLPEIYERGIDIVRQDLASRQGHRKLGLLKGIPDMLAELFLFSLERADALGDEGEPERA